MSTPTATRPTTPYKDANGTVFDDTAYAEKPGFPAMNAASFPYTPYFHTAADATVKVPAWLNDPTNYHNRGDSTYAGESANYGDFVGLDDLFTEKLNVEHGMEDIYKTWVDFGIDGFRIDTAKHVNIEFWQKLSPAILAEAAKAEQPRLLHVRRGLRRPSVVPVDLLDDGRPARHPRLRVPGPGRQLGQGKSGDRPA